MTSDQSLQHSVLGTMVLPVAKALRLYGLDPLELMADVGIDAAKVANPDWRIPQESFARLMECAVELSGQEAFGLMAAEQLQPQTLRGLGLAWLASDTVFDGLCRLARFSKLVTTAADVTVREAGELVHMDFNRSALISRTHPALQDYGVGTVVRMCTLALGDFLAPVCVLLERPRPRSPERWESMLASRVEFDAKQTRISWYRTDIVEPLVTGDPELARANDEQTKAYLDGFLTQSTSREVVDKIVEHLPDGPPSQQQIADALHVSNRTLQRKLKEEGTSFMDLLQETRLQLATKYLRGPNRSVVETAYLLGFSEPSTFSRAFKRWTGMAPADFRAQASGG
jgi:AraC-like DNA-binding protein